MATAAAVAVAALAVVGLTVVNHDTGSTAPLNQQTSVEMPNPHAHYQRPLHSGVQPGMP